MLHEESSVYSVLDINNGVGSMTLWRLASMDILQEDYYLLTDIVIARWRDGVVKGKSWTSDSVAVGLLVRLYVPTCIRIGRGLNRYTRRKGISREGIELASFELVSRKLSSHIKHEPGATMTKESGNSVISSKTSLESRWTLPI